MPAAALLLSAFGGYYAGYQSALSKTGMAATAVSADTAQVAPGSAIKRETLNYGTPPADGNLVARLSAMQQQMDALRNKYQRLKDKSQLNADEQADLQALPELVMASIDQVPLELIAPSIERYTQIPSEVLQSMPDQRAFVNRLAEVAMDGIVSESDFQPEPVFGPVSFSRNAGYAAPQDVFTTTDLVVFAEFDSYSFARSEVLVKWYREGDGKVVLFKQMPIRSNDRNYVWINNADGIEPGKYKVEVYEISQEMPLLSTGRYRVEQVS